MHSGVVIAKSCGHGSRLIREAAGLVQRLLRKAGLADLTLLDEDAHLTELLVRMSNGQQAGSTFVFAFVGPYETDGAPSGPLEQRTCELFDGAIFALCESLSKGLYAEGTAGFDPRERDLRVRAAIGYSNKLQLPPPISSWQFWRSRSSDGVDAVFRHILVRHASALLEKKMVAAVVSELRVAWDTAAATDAIKNDARWGELGIICQSNWAQITHSGDNTASLL